MVPQSGDKPYPDVAQQPNFAGLELETLAFWERDHTFQASVDARAGGDNEFIFYDGPPFANGLPHYGHLLTGFVKDAVPRYQTMKGRKVERRWGWDCHGLPAEMEAEKELELAGRAAIVEYGIDRFNQYCRNLVLRTADAWERYVTRQARWVDFAHDYKTMDTSYMESVMWAFKQLWEKGLAYEGYRVLPYCWECETPLSNFETRQDDSYRPRQDPAVTVVFTLEPGPGSSIADRPLKALVWTTTPWTLPSNLALAVGDEIQYVIVASDGDHYLVGRDRLDAYLEMLFEAEVVATVDGAELVGRTYQPLFPYFAESSINAFRVLSADFVAIDEGTGIVHMAPGFGEDDQRVCESAGIGVVCPVDDRGRFTPEVTDFAGQQVFEANPGIIAHLKSAGSILRHDTYEHSYPHCWRTDTPLIYRAVSSWFVNVSAIKDQMVELNQRITWTPPNVRDGAFGKWLEGARDWSISRNRFWGSPIPVWQSDDPAYPRIDVYGSLDELEADFGVRPTDLHRPYIDNLTRPNPDDPTGRSVMRRVSDVLDCWFDSGSMPYAQVHYPFENTERFEAHFPADFIVEYIGQTRGWFYTLHVLSTALFACPPFQACVAHGNILGNDGRKASKRLRNFPDPEEMFAKYGADAVRWTLLSSSVLRGQDLIVEDRAIAEAVRNVLNPIWNAWYFFCLYANTDQVKARVRTDATGVLDRYILAKTAQLLTEVAQRMDSYDLTGACASLSSFLDSLNNWYIRRSRDRFWEPRRPNAEEDQDKIDAYDTLGTVLGLLCQAAAPLLPMLTEAIYQPLTGSRSVHLTDWPDASTLPHDPELARTMDRVRDVCSAAHSIRKANGLRARLPLSRLEVASPDSADLAPYIALIADEVNVNEVVLSADVVTMADSTIAVNPSALGPRLGPDTQKVIAAAKQGDWTRTGASTLVVGGIELSDSEFSLRLVPKDKASMRVLPEHDGLVKLDLTMTPELEAEGLARDVVRQIQLARRGAGLHVSDHIWLRIMVPAEAIDSLGAHRPYIATQTLAHDLELTPFQAGPGRDAEDDLGPGGVLGSGAQGEVYSSDGRLHDGRPIAIKLARA
ncbi:MAG: isoleucine--tRNA ligase [Acidimicrobiales bacterium]